MATTAGVDACTRQRVLDASLSLQMVRRDAIASLVSGERDDSACLVVTGSAERLNEWMLRTSLTWRHLLSTRPTTSAKHLRMSSLANNRRCLRGGMQMVSIFDNHGTDPDARELLRAEGGPYRHSHAPLQMRLVDEREVYLHGPGRHGIDSILRLRSPRALHAAREYWNAVLLESGPFGLPPELAGLTDRQRRGLDLLRQDLTDERIAERLGVCVRTIRGDIASAMESMGVRSRFSAGVAYARLTAAGANS